MLTSLTMDRWAYRGSCELDYDQRPSTQDDIPTWFDYEAWQVNHKRLPATVMHSHWPRKQLLLFYDMRKRDLRYNWRSIGISFNVIESRAPARSARKQKRLTK
jgi:hypothetical protein